jgi:hypothetical protein
MQLPEYLSSTFPGLVLAPPLFYSWPVAIRFDLNAEEAEHAYAETVLCRATTLYESIFQPNDMCFLVSGISHYISRSHSSPRSGPRFGNPQRANIFQLSRRYALGLHGVAGRQRIIEHEDKNNDLVTTFRWTQITTRQIGYKFILNGLNQSRYRFRGLRIDDQLYFVNCTRNIIFHMYDDRGADVIATKVDDLRSLYITHSGWILEYDRRRIDKVFVGD